MSLAFAARRRGGRKGYHQGHKYMAQAVADAMWRWSDGGVLPIVVDAASCTLGLKEDVVTQLKGERKEPNESLKIIDSIAWCRDLMPNLNISRKLQRVAVHPTCSTTDLGLAGALKQIAGCLADEVEVPVGTTCCGTAGDRGLLHPELVVSATREVRVVLIDRPPTFRRIEPVRWAFGTRPGGRMGRSFSCSRN